MKLALYWPLGAILEVVSLTNCLNLSLPDALEVVFLQQLVPGFPVLQLLPQTVQEHRTGVLMQYPLLQCLLLMMDGLWL